MPRLSQNKLLFRYLYIYTSYSGISLFGGWKSAEIRIYICKISLHPCTNRSAEVAHNWISNPLRYLIKCDIKRCWSLELLGVTVRKLIYSIFLWPVHQQHTATSSLISKLIVKKLLILGYHMSAVWLVLHLYQCKAQLPSAVHTVPVNCR